MIKIRRHLKFCLVLIVVLVIKCSISIITPLELRVECRKILYFKQKVDHFNLLSDGNEYFNHRFIYSNRSRIRGVRNPIIFFISSTSDLISTCEQNVQAWEICEKVGGLMVFAEHRYFGTSLPRGNVSHTYPNYRYLTLDQVLEDFAHLIKHIRTEMYMHRGESNSEEAEEEDDSYEESERRKGPLKPRVSHEESEESEEDEHEAAVITMGAGYGAMLATWMRTKFAHVVVGALASSAPLIQSRYSEFSELVTKSYASVDQRCPRVIRRLWSDINMILKAASSSQNNVLATMSSIFGLCRTLRLDEVVEFKEWIRVVIGRLAVYNYQHASSILKPLPAYPVKSACTKIVGTYEALNASDEYRSLKAVAQGINIYANYTNKVKCIDLDKEHISNLDRINMDIMTCSGIKLHFTSNGIDDMFEPTREFNFGEFTNQCQQLYNITPVGDSFSISFPSRLEEFYSYSNLILSNGNLDPFYSSGIYSYVTNRINVIFIENAAHQADLLRSTNNDSESLKKARTNEVKIIRKWIDDYESEIFINKAAQHSCYCVTSYFTIIAFLNALIQSL